MFRHTGLKNLAMMISILKKMGPPVTKKLHHERKFGQEKFEFQKITFNMNDDDPMYFRPQTVDSWVIL